MFNKSSSLFPVKDRYVYLSHCSISPLYGRAAEKGAEVLRAQSEKGILGNLEYKDWMNSLHEHLARIMQTDPDNLAFVKNTAEGMSMIANGYPFAPGDEIISYIHEYPSNHYPWRIQENRKVILRLLPNWDATGGTVPSGACAWTLKNLEEMITPRTRLVAISHVQFSSGYAADLKQLGEFCRSHGIDLVVDAAQSLGCLPVTPDEWNISAVVASGWKWLLGPVGTGVMFTAPEFRKKLGHVLAGAELMRQDSDYLNHTWAPHPTARRFEYSTSHLSLAAALEVCLREVQARYGLEAIRSEVFRLQDRLIQGIDPEKYKPLLFPEANRSGILSIICRQKEPETVQNLLAEQGIVTSARSGYLRLAPYFYNTEEEMDKTLSVINGL